MNTLKRHLALILSIFIIFTMCPSTLYASSIDTDGTAPEITEPEPDAAQGKAIPDESESITEEIFDEAAYVTAEETVDETEDEAAPVIEEMIPETSESPDMDDYAGEPAPEADAQDFSSDIDVLPESEELVGKRVTIAEDIVADFNSSTGALVFISLYGRTTFPSDWLSKSGIESGAIKSIDFNCSFEICPPNDCSNLFADLPNLRSIDLSLLDTSNVTNMSYMFLRCSSLTDIDLTCFDTSNVELMTGMFASCSSLTELNLGSYSGFSTSNVISTQLMFSDCTNLTTLQLHTCDFSKVARTRWMFDSCNKLKFLRTPKNISVSIELPGTLYRYSGIACTELPKLSQSILLTRSKTLSKGSLLVGDNVTASFNASSGTFSFYSENGTLWPHFLNRIDLDKKNIKTINTASGTVYFPEECTSLFADCTNLKTLDLSHFGRSSISNAWRMFHKCESLQSLDLSCLDTTDMNSMVRFFEGCPSLTDLNISSFDTSNVTTMFGMFTGCRSLKTLDLSNFDTGNVTEMGRMFMNCYSLTSLDLSNFKTPKLEGMQLMFSQCKSLAILDMSGFDLSKVPEFSGSDSTLIPFLDCTNLRIFKTPKKNPIAHEMPVTMYDQTGKSYSKLPVTSKSLILFRPKRLATDYRKYGKLFTDVLDPTHPYYNAIYWAAQKGITKGYSDGTFGIDKPCTRGHAVMFLWRMAGCPRPRTVSRSPFSDVPMSHTFYKAVLWAQQKGITTGYTSGSKKGKFGIDENCTRGQIMTFIWRYKGKPKPKLVSRTPFSDVPKNHPYYQAILWGSQNGVTNGYTTGPYRGMFGIDRACTRGQIVTFLYRIR